MDVNGPQRHDSTDYYGLGAVPSFSLTRSLFCLKIVFCHLFSVVFTTESSEVKRFPTIGTLCSHYTCEFEVHVSLKSDEKRRRSFLEKGTREVHVLPIVMVGNLGIFNSIIEGVSKQPPNVFRKMYKPCRGPYIMQELFIIIS